MLVLACDEGVFGTVLTVGMLPSWSRARYEEIEQERRDREESSDREESKRLGGPKELRRDHG